MREQHVDIVRNVAPQVLLELVRVLEGLRVQEGGGASVLTSGIRCEAWGQGGAWSVSSHRV